MPLTYEVRFGDAPWVCAATLGPEQLPGSITHTGPGDSRDLLVFKCFPGHSVIALSIGGSDREEGALRQVDSYGFDVVATLHAGEEFEMPVKSDSGIEYRARWRHVA